MIRKSLFPLLFVVPLGCAHDQGHHGDPHHAPAPSALHRHAEGHHHAREADDQHGDTKGHHRAHEGGAAHSGAHGHRGAHRRFADPEKWSRVFDAKERDGWQRPARVVKKLALDPGDHIADIGAGTGYFTLHFARAVPRGRVYTIDIEPKMVAHASARAKKGGLSNVVGSVASADDAKIPAPVDVAFLCNTYHHISARQAYFSQLAKSLKSKGRVVIVDYKGGELPVGPPPGHRVLPAQLDEEMKAAGYRRVELDEETLPYQYIAIYGR